MGKKYTVETAQEFFDKYNCFKKLYFLDEEVNILYQQWHNGTHRPFNDFLWSLFNTAITKNGEYFSCNIIEEVEFYHNGGIIYSEMANFRREEGASKEKFSHLLKLAEDSRLRSSVAQCSDPHFYQVVVISGHCCEVCDSLNQHKYDIDDYLENPRLDATKCIREWGCNCCTAIIPKRDENGRLIRR